MHDKLPLNFETIYTEYTEVEKTFALTPRYNESQAWTAFKGLLDEHMLQYVDARYAQPCQNHHSIYLLEKTKALYVVLALIALTALLEPGTNVYMLF